MKFLMPHTIDGFLISVCRSTFPTTAVGLEGAKDATRLSRGRVTDLGYSLITES